MLSVEPGRVVVTASTAVALRVGAEGAQQEDGIGQLFIASGGGSSPDMGDSSCSRP
jgi:hypothetical protein